MKSPLSFLSKIDKVSSASPHRRGHDASHMLGCEHSQEHEGGDLPPLLELLWCLQHLSSIEGQIWDSQSNTVSPVKGHQVGPGP